MITETGYSCSSQSEAKNSHAFLMSLSRDNKAGILVITGSYPEFCERLLFSLDHWIIMEYLISVFKRTIMDASLIHQNL